MRGVPRYRAVVLQTRHGKGHSIPLQVILNSQAKSGLLVKVVPPSNTLHISERREGSDGAFGHHDDGFAVGVFVLVDECPLHILVNRRLPFGAIVGTFDEL